jgi:eukaryotic-like serine/threonine-protein kinase
VKSGDIIGGRYRLERKIGEGATGRIWLVQDGRLDRRAAIKFLHAPTPARQARLARRVALEARIAASIQHRNVIQIFDFGTHEGNLPYIVMEALSGLTLGEAFDSAQSFSLDTLIHIICEMLRGLAAVHDAGIVHRDLKPENIFLVKEARGRLSPKLLDFGISRSLEPETRSSAVTTTEGMILGTPQYMSPEQARGDSHIDKRTDIYSIGTIMFEAFSGSVPFPGLSTAELLIAVIQSEAPPLYEMAPEIGPALCAVVDKALTKDRNGRFAHAAEMLDAVLAASLDIPAELDRHAALFPPASISSRVQKDPDETEDGGEFEAPPFANSDPYSLPRTVQQPGAPRRGQRSNAFDPSGPPRAAGSAPPVTPIDASSATTLHSFTTPRAIWVGIAATAILGASIAAAYGLIDGNREPEGSGLIVVQAPSLSPPVGLPAPAEPAAAQPLAVQPVEPVALDEREPRNKKGSAAKARKAPAMDPMQLLAARVAESFSQQKASVIACLNEHAADLEGAPQLQVRLQIDLTGRATAAELQPAAIASKPVAHCIQTAVTRMSFPRPEQPMTFRVPLLWRRR